MIAILHPPFRQIYLPFRIQVLFQNLFFLYQMCIYPLSDSFLYSYCIRWKEDGKIRVNGYSKKGGVSDQNHS